MKIIKGQSYIFNPNLHFNNKHFIRCNFTQEEPFTQINAINCKFENCNLVNCIVDESNEIIDSNIAQRKITETEEEEITVFYDKKTRKEINRIKEKKING